MALYSLRYFVTDTKTGAKNDGVEVSGEFGDDAAALAGFQAAMDRFREQQGRYYDQITFTICEGNKNPINV